MTKKENKKINELPTTLVLETELEKVKSKTKYFKLLKNTIYVLVIVASISILLATLILPVLKIHGESMRPNLLEEDIVLSVKKSNFKSGDVVAFYYNNKILIKRVVATSLDWVNIDESGNVFINDELLEEKYLEEKSLGDVDIEFPYQVPEGKYFVLGDKRDTSIDSRSSLIGCINEEDIIGKIIFKVWPLKRIGLVK